MTGTEEQAIQATTDALLDARRTRNKLVDLPTDLQPASMDAVYAIQDRLALGFGEIGGWKIGAPTPDAAPLFAPMPLAWMASSGSTLTGDRWIYRGLEAEIAFLVGEDLPPRAHPYTRDQVLGAMASCHPAIEVLESAFVDPTKAEKLAMLADLQMHGGFVHGPAFPGWRTFDFTAEHVLLSIDGVVRVDRTGSNTSGDLLKLLPFLANQGATRTGGLRAGQWITTGSWTGNTMATTSSVVDVDFTTAGSVDIRFS